MQRRAQARHHSVPRRYQGNKEGDIMKLRGRRHNFQGGKKFIDNIKLSSRRRKLQGCKATNNMKAVQAQGQVRKSLRLIDRGYINRYYEDEGGLEVIKAPCGNGIMRVLKEEDDEEDDLDVDDDVEDDDDDADDYYTYKNYHDDGDWMPKSYKRSRIHLEEEEEENYHNNDISSAHVYDVLCTPNVDVDDGDGGTHHHHHSNCTSNPDIDNAHDGAHHRLSDGTTIADVNNGNDGPDQPTDFGMTLAHSHDDNAHNNYEIPIDYDNTPPNIVAYCRRKRRSTDRIFQDCEYRDSPRQLAHQRCRHSVVATSCISALLKHAFPSWIRKKPRVFRSQQGKARHEWITVMSNENRQHDAHVDFEFRTAQTWKHGRSHKSYSMAVSQIHENSQGPDTISIPLRRDSSDVALATVLEALESADSDPTRSLHEVHSTHITVPWHTTHGAKIPSLQQTKEVDEENCTQKERNEAPMEPDPTQKPRRKKHRPKVQRDIFHKAARMVKNTKKKVTEQGGDEEQSCKQKNITRKPRVRKGQVTHESTGKTSMRILKKCSRMQGGALSADDSDALKDENLGINSLCNTNRENSLIPVQSTILQNVSNQFRENHCLQNVTVNEITYLYGMLAPLTSGEQPEGHLRLNLELIECMNGNKLTPYSHFLGQQLRSFINESRLLPHFESTTMGTDVLSLVQLKPDDSTQMLLAEEPHNQLDMVVYDQKREMVMSKSIRLRSKIRAKVQLDVEHERIWPLLVLGGIPTDFEDIHYWNKERELMKRRVEVFIHKMQSVQGDRHFSPWKGSILDSVVGAFLTQNVSDHLSSSAFMSVSSRYPSKHMDGVENACNSASNGTPNTENKCALETSGISCELQSDMQDISKISSGLMDEESSHKEGNISLPILEDHGSTTSTSETSIEGAEFSNHIRPSSSLRAVKTVLRNTGMYRPIETRDNENQGNSNTPIITAVKEGCVLTEEDCRRQTGMRDLERAFPNLLEDKIPVEEIDISISSVSDHQYVTINHAVQSDMRHLEIASPQFIDEKTPMKQSNISMSSLSLHTSRMVDYMHHLERAPICLMEEDISMKSNDFSVSSVSLHNGIAIDYTRQSGMQLLERASSGLAEEDRSMIPSDIRSSIPGHHIGMTVEYSGGMQHLERASTSLMENNISIKPSDNSNSSLGHHNSITVNYTGQRGLQHMERASPPLMEENNLTMPCVSHKSSITADHTGEKGMERASTPLMEENNSMTPCISHKNTITAKHTSKSGMERAPLPLMEENNSMMPCVSHNTTIIADHSGQSGMQGVSTCLMEEDILRKPNDFSISSLSHNSIMVDYTGHIGLQHLKKASPHLMKEEISMKQSNHSSLSASYHEGMPVKYDPYDTNDSCAELLDKETNCSSILSDEVICKHPSVNSPLEPTKLVTHSNTSPSIQEVRTSTDENHTVNQYTMENEGWQSPCPRRTEVYQNSTVCRSLFKDDVPEQINAKVTTLLNSHIEGQTQNNINTAHHTGVHDVNHAVNQCIMKNEGWQGLGRWTKVYQNGTVCRSLFKDDVPEQINDKASILLNSHIEGQALNKSNTAHHTGAHLTMIQENEQVDCGSGIVDSVVAPFPALNIVGNKRCHSLVVQESKQADCGSGRVHSAVAPSPSFKIVGNKRRHSLSGIERAHLEENQNGRKKNQTQDWESMRKKTLESCSSNENTCEENLGDDAHCDSVDWDSVRRASVEELAETIKERGMHHVLSGRIKAFLKTLQEEQGILDLEWLRKVSPENAKAYLMGVRGLGVKSVECIRLLALHHVAFPVDVNVGRICVRLGWVPIEPLPEQLQLHLLELYPIQETIQKYLWPRLCTLDQKTLYELHYQLITFGKVFCTKSKPNCNACPMRTECKHFASAYASAKLLLTGSHEPPLKSLCSGKPVYALTSSSMDMEENTIVENQEQDFTRCPQISEIDCNTTDSFSNCQPFYIEEPASPEETPELEITDIEDFPCIYGSLNDFTEDLLKAGNFSESPYLSMDGHNSYIKENNKKWDVHTDAGVDSSCKCLTTKGSFINIEGGKDIADGGGQCTADGTILATPSASTSCFGDPSNDSSHERFCSYESDVVQEESDVSEEATNALVSLPPGAYLPAPKLKNIDRLRTIHYVYELPDTHPLLEQADIREKDDPSLYLLAIWSPGEAPHSQHEIDEVCQESLCKFSGASANETVSGTLLIPCRTAMRGSFPLNGTYFQVNEVFADHASSLEPFQVPRSHIWRLQRRFVYFGTSVSNIFRGLTSDEIKNCFLRGHVCVRGFDRKKRTPRPLVCRLHFPISKQIQQRHKKDETEASHTH